MKNRMYYFSFQKLIVYTVLTLMVAQLIYFNSIYGYVHLIIYFLFIATLDVYKPEYRNVKFEIFSTLIFVITTLTLIISDLLGTVSGYIYFPLIIILSLINIKLIWNFKHLYVNKEHEKINDFNLKMFSKDNRFLIVYSYLTILILLGIIGKSLHEVIII